MGRIGETLKNAREAKNLTLRDVEAATKIRLKYLEALESEDYSQLPGQVYAIGFLKSYAKFLGLDDSALVAEYKAANINEETMQTPAVELRDEESKKNFSLNPKKVKFAGFVLAFVLLVAFSNVLFNRDGGHQENLTPSSASIEQQEEPSSRGLEEETAVENPAVDNRPQENLETVVKQPQFSGVNVQVRAIDEPGNACWINVITDGKQYFSGTLKAGESMDFTGEQVVKIKFGNAGGVRVVVNGQDQGVIGKKGSVKTLEFNIDEINS